MDQDQGQDVGRGGAVDMSTLGRKCQVPMGEVRWAGWPSRGQQGRG